MKVIIASLRLSLLCVLLSTPCLAFDPQFYAARIISRGSGGNEFVGTIIYAKYLGNAYIITAYHNVYQTSGLWLVFDEGSVNRIPIQDFVEPNAELDAVHDVAIFRCTPEGGQRLEGAWKGLDLNRRPVELQLRAQGYNGRHVIAVGNPRLSLLNNQITPLNYIAGGTVSEYSELGKRMPHFVDDAVMSKVPLLFLEGVQVTHGFSGGPILFSQTQFLQDDAELVGMVEGGDSGHGNIHSWAVPASAILGGLTDTSAYKTFPPATWDPIRLSETTFASVDSPFVTILQVVPWNTAGDNNSIPLQINKPNAVSITFRAAGSYSQLAASLRAPDGVQILSAPGVAHVNESGLLQFTWSLKPSMDAKDGVASIDFLTEGGQYSFRLPLNIRMIDEAPKFDVGVLSERDIVPGIAGDSDDFEKEPVQYKFDRVGGIPIISPEVPYVSRYLNGGLITSEQLSHGFRFVPPILSLKMFNFTDKPLDLSEIRINVESAKVNTEPFLWVSASDPPNSRLTFSNDGWGKVIDPTIQFHISRSEPIAEKDWEDKQYETLNIKSFDESGDFDLVPYMVGDILSGDKAWISGNISYRTEDNETRVHRFKSTVYLRGPRGGGGNVLPEFVANARLDPDRSGYAITIPVSRRIVAGELEHLGIRLFSPKSAHFVLNITFRNTAGVEFQRSKVIVDLIRCQWDFNQVHLGNQSLEDFVTIDQLRDQLYSTVAADRVRATRQLAKAALDEAVRTTRTAHLRRVSGQNPDERAFRSIQSALTDQSKDVRIAAIEGLEPLGYKTVGGIRAMLTDTEPDVRAAAASALRGEHILGGVNDHLWDIYLAGNAAEIQKEDLSLLATSLDRNHLDTAACIYAWIGETEVANTLAVRALADTSARVANLAAGRSPGETETLVAIEQLKAASPDDRYKAIHILGELKGRAAVASNELAELLQDKAIVTQGNVLLGDDEPTRVRYYVAEALGEIGEGARSAIPQMIVAVQDADVNTKLEILEALARMGWSGEGESTVAGLLANSDERTRNNAAYLLSQLGAKSSDASVVKLKLATRRTPSESLMEALASVRPNDKDVLSILWQYLESKTLRPDSGHEDPIEWAACSSLHGMDQSLLPEIKSFFDKASDKRSADILFQCVGSPAVSILTNSLDRDSSEIRILAARTLGRYGSLAADSVPKLSQLLNASDPSVKDAAENALRRIN
jgi:HEAT repeat protein